MLGAARYDDAHFFIKRQAAAATIGLAGLLVAMNLNYRWLMRSSPLLQITRRPSGYGLEVYAPK